MMRLGLLLLRVVNYQLICQLSVGCEQFPDRTHDQVWNPYLNRYRCRFRRGCKSRLASHPHTSSPAVYPNNRNTLPRPAVALKRLS